MKIRIVRDSDAEFLSRYDKHISKEEQNNSISLGRIIVAEDRDKVIGWLRWNLFWDNTPFMNMLFLLKEYRNCGYGSAMISEWEKRMKQEGYQYVMTSSLSSEPAQHLYRKMHYTDSGALRLPGEPLEIIFLKELEESDG